MSWLELARKICFPKIEESKVPQEPDKGSFVDTMPLYATSLLSSARGEIDRADSKASILLAASGVAAGALLAGLMCN